MTSSSDERIVVDASAVVELLLGSSRAPAVRQLVAGAAVAAPDLLNAEVLSAFRRLEAAGRVNTRQAEHAVELLAVAPIERFATAHLSREVWRRRHNMSAYDATYVALAAALECPLVTADQRLAAAPDTGIAMVGV